MRSWSATKIRNLCDFIGYSEPREYVVRTNYSTLKSVQYYPSKWREKNKRILLRGFTSYCQHYWILQNPTKKKWELSTQHRENFIGELNPVHTTNRLFNWYVLCLTIVILVRRKMNFCDKFDTNTHVHNHWRAREIKKISAQFFFPTKKKP